MNTSLLLELYSEEIPPKMQQYAEEYFADAFKQMFINNRITYTSIEIFSTPRRIVIYAQGVNLVIPALQTKIKGPKTTVSKDIINRFCLTHNTDLQKLEAANNYYYYNASIPERNVADVLKCIIPDCIKSCAWNKSMHWGNYDIQWIRPLRNILCLFDCKLLDVHYGHLVANNLTFGHQCMYGSKSIEVVSPSDYFIQLDKSYVIFSRKRRSEIIIQGITDICKAQNLNPNIDELLLSEVVGLVEYPNVLMGNIRHDFLSLPQEILTTSMKVNQRYFTTYNIDGTQGDKFIFVANIDDGKNNLEIIHGNERVLSARLEDAKYFFEDDSRRTLSSRIEDLSKISFHQKLGTLQDKTTRIVAICKHFFGNMDLGADLILAGMLCKADLTTSAVNEFPELQGIMGQHYSKLCDNVNDDVAIAIREHYMPRGANDSVPRNEISAILSIVDKIDSLVGLFLAGEKPTGSADPYALRRLCISIIRVCLEIKITINIVQLIQYTTTLYITKFPELQSIESSDIYSFIIDRIKNYFKTSYSDKYIAALLDLDSLFNIKQFAQRLEYLSDMMRSSDGNKILSTYKRIYNILPHTNNLHSQHINTALLNAIETKIYNALQSHNYTKEHMLLVADLILQLFDSVLINDDSNIDVYTNRMHLLENIVVQFRQVAKFELI